MSDPRNTLETVIQTAIDTNLKDVHTCLPAVIQSIDYDEQLIECQPTIQKLVDGVLTSLPLLIDVPIRFPKSADFSITYPLKEGDHVLVIFAERSIDNWLLDSGIQSANDVRRHSLSDGFAIPMVYPQPDKITDFDDTNLHIRTTNGEGIKLTPTGNIELNGNDDFVTAFNDMKSAFDEFKTDFNTHITTVYDIHTHPDPVSGNSGVPNQLGSETSADMSGAKVETVKVP